MKSFSRVKPVCVGAYEDNAPPWCNDQLWQAANSTMAYLACRYRHSLYQVKETAGHINSLLVFIDEPLDWLSRETCAQCTAPCCLVADVSYDFKDLLFIHMADQAIPPGQPRRMTGEICRNLGREGCLIPRLQRPWICTWYICAVQKNYLTGRHEILRKHLLSVIAEISMLRKQMETLFIATVA
ncbi:MAG: hypothetical protein KAH06_04800 [Desulfobacterales bacterium]|nr:hypothetical protein [Desulfobacterales bacterium]